MRCVGCRDVIYLFIADANIYVYIVLVRGERKESQLILKGTRLTAAW
jgi:hypothetical protein